MKQIHLEYQDQSTTFEATVAHDDSKPGAKPAICIFHAWNGKDGFAQTKALQIAEMGYVGCALDMYGKGRYGTTTEECSSLMSPLLANRSLLQKRALAGYHKVSSLPFIDPSQIGAIGFCFGGLCALDLARTGIDLKGTVSFHGLLSAPTQGISSIKSKILALHGHDDPMVSPQDVLLFEEEMTKAKADWQMHVYGATMHGFTNPQANDPGLGTLYSQRADHRAWMAMQTFFSEIFSL